MPGKKLSLSFIVFSTLLISVSAFAKLTYTSVSGASAVDLTDPTKPVMFAGFAGSCTADPSTGTCNSCSGSKAIGGTGLVPCNETNVAPSTNLNIVIATDNITATSAPTAKIGSSTGAVVGNVTWTAGATSFTVTVKWGDLCSGITSGNTDCSQDIAAGILYISFDGTGGAAPTDSMSIKIVTRYAKVSAVSPSWTYLDCKTDPDPNTLNVGFCHFVTFPGDKKIYADEMTVSTNFPASPSSGALYKNAVFFYEIQTAADGSSDAATIARITNASPSIRLPVGTSKSSPLSDTRIDGLTNGARYCLAMASQDQTGLIAFYTPVASVAAADLCNTPEPVVGLLDDKHCFIATAAFGSDMAPEVQSFREFRNKFLLPFSWGQKFVKTYYKYSPKYASLIANNETAKIIARGALWPLLLFARMSVAFGFWLSLLIMGLAIVMALELSRRLILEKNVRGEL